MNTNQNLGLWTKKHILFVLGVPEKMSLTKKGTYLIKWHFWDTLYSAFKCSLRYPILIYVMHKYLHSNNNLIFIVLNCTQIILWKLELDISIYLEWLYSTNFIKILIIFLTNKNIVSNTKMLYFIWWISYKSRFVLVLKNGCAKGVSLII